MSFMAKIKESNPQTESTLQALKSSNLPILLWGCGELGGFAYDFLKEKKIEISDVFVNIDKKDVPSTFRGFSVLDLNEVCEKYRSFNVLVGNAYGYSVMDALKKDVVNINEIYAVDLCKLIPHEPIDYNFVLKNKEQFEWTYKELFDELSRNSYLMYLNSKVNNPTNEFLPLVSKNAYFCDDIIKLSFKETLIDCGAFDGDTIKRFLKELKKKSISDYKSIYAFEPDKSNFANLCKATREYPNIYSFNKGVWHEQTTVRFYQDGTISSAIRNNGETEIEVDTIDNVLSSSYDSDDFHHLLLKMDIEGAELNALKGAVQTILKYKPKLAISAYHKANDLITIPQYIKSLVPEYKFYFRLHNYTITEAVLYAVCE